MAEAHAVLLGRREVDDGVDAVLGDPEPVEGELGAPTTEDMAIFRSHPSMYDEVSTQGNRAIRAPRHSL